MLSQAALGTQRHNKAQRNPCGSQRALAAPSTARLDSEAASLSPRDGSSLGAGGAGWGGPAPSTCCGLVQPNQLSFSVLKSHRFQVEDGRKIIGAVVGSWQKT